MSICPEWTEKIWLLRHPSLAGIFIIVIAQQRPYGGLRTEYFEEITRDEIGKQMLRVYLRFDTCAGLGTGSCALIACHNRVNTAEASPIPRESTMIDKAVKRPDTKA